MQANELSNAEWIEEIAASLARKETALAVNRHSWQRSTLRQQIAMYRGWLEAMRAEEAGK